MTDLFRSWILGITGAVLLSAVALALVPKGKFRSITSLVCGLVMVVALVQPVIDFDFTSFSQYMVQYKNNIGQYSTNLEEENLRLTRTIIEEESAAYILDKAYTLGIETITAEVETRLSDENEWYPYAIQITGSITEAQKQELSDYIEADLGIPSDRQSWSET